MSSIEVADADTFQQIVLTLTAVMSIDLQALEQLVQQAHEVDPQQMGEPAERFVVSRQTLRMLWFLRLHLDDFEEMGRDGDG